MPGGGGGGGGGFGGGGGGFGGGGGGGAGGDGAGGPDGVVVQVPLILQLPSPRQSGQCIPCGVPSFIAQQVHFLSQSLVVYVPCGSQVGLAPPAPHTSQVGLQIGEVAGA